MSSTEGNMMMASQEDKQAKKKRQGQDGLQVTVLTETGHIQQQGLAAEEEEKKTSTMKKQRKLLSWMV